MFYVSIVAGCSRVIRAGPPRDVASGATLLVESTSNRRGGLGGMTWGSGGAGTSTAHNFQL